MSEPVEGPQAYIVVSCDSIAEIEETINDYVQESYILDQFSTTDRETYVDASEDSSLGIPLKVNIINFTAVMRHAETVPKRQ